MAQSNGTESVHLNLLTRTSSPVGEGGSNPPSSLSPIFAAKKPVSPYSGYNGQLLTSVYQPTEMALMHKGSVSVMLGSAAVASSCLMDGLPTGVPGMGTRVWGTPMYKGC